MRLRGLSLGVLCLALGACASHPPAPVIERSTRPAPAEVPVDGYYRVRRGDTLYGIAFKYGLDQREIARWNAIEAPYVIYPDQVVRLSPPPSSGAARSGGVVTAGVPKPASRSTEPAPSRPKPEPERRSRPPPKPPVAEPAPSSTPAAVSPTQASASSGWAWPVEGRVLRTFKAGDPSRNGLDIAGKEGQSVHAAGDGEVVYSGNGLIGYGELVIVKHDERMLSAYAHNRRRLVSEGQLVSRGQEIAELGRNDRNESVLHFEIRRDGKPVNPLEFLPSR